MAEDHPVHVRGESFVHAQHAQDEAQHEAFSVSNWLLCQQLFDLQEVT